MADIIPMAAPRPQARESSSPLPEPASFIETRTHRPFIEPETLGRLNGDDEAISAIKARLQGPARHLSARPSTLERIANALGSTRMFDFYLGFYAGSMMTVGLAYVWSVLS